MISFPLNLAPLPAAIHEAVAWFIPGDDPACWLEEIATWQIPMQDLRLYVLPTSLADRTPIGVLVEVPTGAKPVAVLRGQPYGRLAGCLFLPADAMLYPEVSETELREKLVLPVQVLQPIAGLIGFDESDIQHVHDLLERPIHRPTDWNHATPGEAVAGKLLAVEPEEMPGLNDILESGRDDIGSASPDELPRNPDESRLGQAAKMLGIVPPALGAMAAMGSLKVLQWLSNMMPGGASPQRPKKGQAGPGTPAKKGWMDSLRDWMNRRLASVSQPLQDARRRELERLMRMLEKNPDEGLRFAIRLRDVPSRGTANPGSQLASHETNFNLSSLRGGGPAGDKWSIPEDVQKTLTQRYREAANRELRLGRYRRAAYIFADLLGDFSSAANALEQGRFFREAAVIYRDHLKNKPKAAECLERGGLLPEAIAIYQDLLMWEKAGDLCTTIDRRDQAAECYRAQVAAYLKREDRLSAAQLLETKLNAPDEALDLLTHAWPASDASGKCLLASFQLLGRLARHEETSTRIRQLHRSASPLPQGVTLAGILGEIATTYPEQNVRTVSADATRVLAGRHLSDVRASDRVKLARAIVPLSPEDRLLARDVERFLNPPPRKPMLKTIKRTSKDPVVVRRFHLPAAMSWKTASVDVTRFYALAVNPDALYALRGTWDGKNQGLFWKPFARPREGVSWSLHATAGTPSIIVMPDPGAPYPLHLPATDTFPEKAIFWHPSWLYRRRLRTVAATESGTTWALYDDSLRVYRSESRGLVVSTFALPAPPPPDEHVFMRASSEQVVCAGWGKTLLMYHPGAGISLEELPSDLRQLEIFATSSGIAAGMVDGGVLIQTGAQKQFGEGMIDPLVTFTRGGLLVAANSQGGRVYKVDAGGCRCVGNFAGTGANPIALTAAQNLNEFAAFTADGSVTVFQIPG